MNDNTEMKSVGQMCEQIKSLRSSEKRCQENLVWAMRLEVENKELKEKLEKAYDERGDTWRKSRNKKLKEENKELKEKLTMWYSMMTACELEVEFTFGQQDKKYNPELLDDMDHLPYHLNKLEEENKLIKDEAKMFGEAFNKLKEECNELMKFITGNFNAEPAVKEAIKRDYSQDFINNNGERWEQVGLDFDEYNGNDWTPGYGFTVKDGEYRINVAGGGDHWEDYVITKNGCFIHNKNGKKKVKTFISCAERNYLCVVYLGEDDYKMLEGETDMYEMVQECFIEEIMDYHK